MYNYGKLSMDVACVGNLSHHSRIKILIATLLIITQFDYILKFFKSIKINIWELFDKLMCDKIFINLNKSKQKILWVAKFSGHIFHEYKQLYNHTLG